MNILAVDCGIKTNQLRCLANRGARIKLVPWNYDFRDERGNTDYRGIIISLPSLCHCIDIDGIFISNGPGDPAILTDTVTNISSYISLAANARPVFGICMGHALLCQAIGSDIYKMK